MSSLFASRRCGNSHRALIVFFPPPGTISWPRETGSKRGNGMALRELAKREGDGIVVSLLWDDSAPPGLDVRVDYRDERLGIAYSFRPPRDEALEAFEHPNAYARVARDRQRVRTA